MGTGQPMAASRPMAPLSGWCSSRNWPVVDSNEQGEAIFSNVAAPAPASAPAESEHVSAPVVEDKETKESMDVVSDNAEQQVQPIVEAEQKGQAPSETS